ncbi:muts domain V-domain-containing protein [Entophlyctis helioformis]|nr:muts domain V-domain-containing protein [Entophlyctis helioformis]
MVGCAGALLTFLARTAITGELGLDQRERDSGDYATDDECTNGYAVHAIESLSLASVMHMSVNTMLSLPSNVHRRTMKEGLSLFGILDYTRTKDGKSQLRQWLMRPLLDAAAISQRHDAVEWFAASETRGVRDSLQTSLKHLRSLGTLFSSMRTKLSLRDWQALHQFIFHALSIRATVQECCAMSGLPLTCNILALVHTDLMQELAAYITDVIDFQASKAESRLVVKPDVVQMLPPHCPVSLTVVYFPQLGYLIAVPLRPAMDRLEDYDMAGLAFQFSTETTAFYKSDLMRELDQELGDIHSDIVDRELEIMQQLRETVLDHSDELKAVAQVLTDLDCILSLAEAAFRYGYTRPVMTQEPILDIRRGRHPLHEHCVEARQRPHAAAAAHPRMMLLTGANFSGKSVYLHQVALITIMAHAGSFVPAAASARIGLTDKVLTRIHSNDSVSALKSTFLIDVQQAVGALRNSTPRSLVVMDEFGKGTASQDGIGLLCAVLEAFAARKHACPRVLAATHFHDACHGNPANHDTPDERDGQLLQTQPADLAFYTMKIVENRARDDAEAVSFLYQLEPGRCLDSLGVHCARMAGLPAHVTMRGTVAGLDCLSASQSVSQSHQNRVTLTIDIVVDTLAAAQEIANCIVRGENLPVRPSAADQARLSACETITQLWSIVRQYEHLF